MITSQQSTAADSIDQSSSQSCTFIHCLISRQ